MDLRAVEVVTSWGDELLDVVYVPPSRARQFALGTTQKNHIVTDVRAVAPVEPVGMGDAPTDWWFWTTLSLSAALHAGFIVLLALAPRGASTDGTSIVALPLTYLGRLPDPIEVPTTAAQRSPTPDGRNGGTGTTHAGSEGAMGARELAPAYRRYAVAHRRDDGVQLARAPGDGAPLAAGVLGALRAATGDWSSPTSPFGRETANGRDPADAIGALMGDTMAGSGGRDALGLQGTGRGGGGRGAGTIGLGDLARIGHGAGGGGGNGFGYGGGVAAAWRGRGIGGYGGVNARGAELVVGGLSREVIQRVISRHRAEVSYCYEQELARRPELAGRVVVTFVIGPSGAVQSAAVKSSELAAPAVDECIVDAVRRWAFPAPVGGRIVVVDYPFVFQSTAP